MAATSSEATGGKFDVAPLPAGDAGTGAATLGGWHIGVSRYSAHPEAAAAFATYMTSAENQKFYSIDTTSPPAVFDLYSDPDIQASMPFASPEVVAVTTARPSTVSADKYNQMFTMHATTMVFLFVMPLASAFANYMIPLQIGARDVAFPRLNALSFWIFLFGGIFRLVGGDLPPFTTSGSTKRPMMWAPSSLVSSQP